MYRLQVPRLHCDGCAARVSRAIAGVDPGAAVWTDIPTHEVEVETKAELTEIQAALERIGYPATVLAD